jgi:hypothetical protein
MSEPFIWWLASTSTWGKRVSPVEVLKFSDKTVTLASNGRRTQRLGSFHSYFPAETDAWDWLELRAQNAVEASQAQLQRHRTELGKIQSERQLAGA